MPLAEGITGNRLRVVILGLRVRVSDLELETVGKLLVQVHVQAVVIGVRVPEDVTDHAEIRISFHATACGEQVPIWGLYRRSCSAWRAHHVGIIAPHEQVDTM